MQRLKNQFNLILTAFGFFTRIPIPKNIAFSQSNLNKCNRYLPIVGYVVGAICGLIYITLSQLLPHSVSILLSMASSILLTGAFHEDGFADVCDAFGGGWTKEKILTIMKDSRIGAYGAVGIILLLFTKFSSLDAIPSNKIVIALIAAHVLSRLMAVSTMHSLSYVREDETSKSKPITKSLHSKEILIAFFISLPVLFLFNDLRILLVIIPLILSKYLLERYFKKWIGGYTGDCLGTIQQVTELVVYLTILSIIHMDASNNPFNQLFK
ncbi:adenosylcobinamide-GDP ribazoletransferase [Carboxylicivirga sp. N1Y90]|uniref:adenosylcobinamide-GDP ribazoletransferase n=1 Tax=Carboxylicivirga fragile TaxID=3417571 RepID=UPI003D32C552|nr:adenosylcobinamide-GDP ribazoletransferase [Marinilabiliaceae bacterium N1Y90]